VLFYLCHYGKYTQDGVGVPALKGLGEVLDASARVTLIIMLILLAQGWTISRQQLLHRWQIITAAGVLAVFYLAFIIWDVAGRDPVSTLYVYDATPGYLVCVLVAICAIWFLVYIIQSYRAEAEEAKARLYVRLGALYFLWFLSLPLIVLLALGVAPWVRQKAIDGLLQAVSLIAYSVLTYVLWFSRSDEYFKMKVPDVQASVGYTDL